MSSLLRWVMAPLLLVDRMPQTLEKLALRIEDTMRESSTPHEQKKLVQFTKKQLLKTLHDEDWAMRCAAAISLGRLGDEALIPILHEHFLLEDDETVRFRLTEAVAVLSLKDHHPEGAQLLDQALEDPHWEVRVTAIQALGEWKQDDDTREQIGERLLHLLQEESEWEVKTSLIHALGQLQYIEAFDTLVEMLHEDIDVDMSMMMDLLMAFGRIGAPGTGSLLQEFLLGEENSLSGRAALASGHSQQADEMLLSTLRTATNHKEPSISIQAVSALIRLSETNWKDWEKLGSSLSYWANATIEPSSEMMLESYILHDWTLVPSSEERLLALKELTFLAEWIRKQIPLLWKKKHDAFTPTTPTQTEEYLWTENCFVQLKHHTSKAMEAAQILTPASLGDLYWPYVTKSKKALHSLQIALRHDSLRQQREQLEDALFEGSR